MRIEPPVSVPRLSAACPEATAAALPPLEPPGMRPGCRGLTTRPWNGFWDVMPQAYSCRLALPTRIAPASTSRWIDVAVLAGTWSRWWYEP